MAGQARGLAPGPGSETARVRRGRPRDTRVDEAILSAAVDLLAEAGFARLTMDQVAARSGASKASLYLRWPNKTALVAEAIRRRSRVVPEVPDTGSLREDMLGFLRALLRAKPAAQRAVAAVLGEIHSNPELHKAWRAGTAGALTACCRQIVQRAVARGELPAPADLELLAMLPLTLLQNWSLEHGQPPDDAVAERIVSQFFTPAAHPGTAPAPRPRDDAQVIGAACEEP